MFQCSCQHTDRLTDLDSGQFSEGDSPASSYPRQQFLASFFSVTVMVDVPQLVQACYILDDETGDHVEVRTKAGKPHVKGDSTKLKQCHKTRYSMQCAERVTWI